MLDPAPLRRQKRLRAIALGALTLLCAIGLSTLGLADGAGPLLGVLGLAHTMLSAGLVAFFYAGAGLGIGIAITSVLMPGWREKWWLALAVGPATLLWISHALGTLGFLGGATGRLVATAVCAVGVGLLVMHALWALRARPNIPLPPVNGLLWVVPAALLLVAACNPPGWLWGSEARGYDVLSYHLQLPQEWLRLGRMRPLEHNVYSYLPGAMEGAYLHIAALLGPWSEGRASIDPPVPQGLLAADGLGAIACQLLHAGLALITALLIARVVCVLLRRAIVRSGWRGTGAGKVEVARAVRGPLECGALAGAASLALPWVTVTGSMAYNECAVNALFAGALLAVIGADDDSGLRAPIRRALAAGWLVGMGVACKPTAAFFLAPCVGLVLGSMIHWRSLVPALAACAIAGLVAIGPFLARNAAYGGNPVFPAGVSLFGPAHWSGEQVTRFADHHRERATREQKAVLLFARSGDVTSLGAQPRGVFHEQWGALRVSNSLITTDVPAIFFPAGAAALIVAAFWGGVRAPRVPASAAGDGAGVPGPAGVARFLWPSAVACVLSLAWWVEWSHCQSRFLVPLAVPMSCWLGLASGRLQSVRAPVVIELARRALALACGLVPVVLGASGLLLFVHQGGGRPNAMLPDGTGVRTGANFRDDLRSDDEAQVREIEEGLTTEAFVNLRLPASAGVMLLGDATPFYYTRRVIYATTWDTPPLVVAMRESPDDPRAWGRSLARQGVVYVVVNFSELERLRASGYLDPALTPASVARFLEAACTPVRRPDARGQAIFRLDAAPPDRPATPGGGPSAARDGRAGERGGHA